MVPRATVKPGSSYTYCCHAGTIGSDFRQLVAVIDTAVVENTWIRSFGREIAAYKQLLVFARCESKVEAGKQATVCSAATVEYRVVLLMGKDVSDEAWIWAMRRMFAITMNRMQACGVILEEFVIRSSNEAGSGMAKMR